MKHRILLAVAASAVLTVSAAAQSPITDRLRANLQPSGSQQRQEGLVRVQSTMSFFVSGPTGDSAEADKLREKARRMIYETAARECSLLLTTLANECRLESVNSNVNANRQMSAGQQEGVIVNGTMTFQVAPK